MLPAYTSQVLKAPSVPRSNLAACRCGLSGFRGGVKNAAWQPAAECAPLKALRQRVRNEALISSTGFYGWTTR